MSSDNKPAPNSNGTNIIHCWKKHIFLNNGILNTRDRLKYLVKMAREEKKMSLRQFYLHSGNSSIYTELSPRFYTEMDPSTKLPQNILRSLVHI